MMVKQITVGYNSEGKRIRKRIYANSELELKVKERELLLNAGSYLSSSTTFKEYADKWLKTYKINRSQSTYYMYQLAIDKCENIHHIQLKDIRKTDLQGIINQYNDSPRTCEILRTTFKQIFDSAFADGLIPAFTLKLELPKKQRKENRALTDKEKKAVREAVLPADLRLFLDLEYALGLRPEETRALTKKDFDYKKRTLKICRVSSFGGDQNIPEIRPTKNYTTRSIPLSDALILRVKAFVKDLSTDYLFCGKTGNLWTRWEYQNAVRKMLSSISTALGYDTDITMYTLRHNKATELYYLKGMSTKLKAELMGHSEQMFIRTYSHLDNSKEDLDLFRSTTEL